MTRISTAPDLSVDGLSSLERARRQPLMLGLFIPLQGGAWTPSTYPRSTHWGFEYNAECAIRADELGFDLVFGLSNWLPKGGFGGEMNFRDNTTDPLLVTAALGPLTKNIMLISTVHILYRWHPVTLAKYAATLDRISNGRWGLNMVTGFRPVESRMFGLVQPEHDKRYEMAEEFVTIMEKLWESEDDFTFAGQWYQTERGWVAPKPVHGRPVIVNAASSGPGMEFAARHSDIMFITSPGGADIHRAVETLPAHNQKIKDVGRRFGRELKTIINPHILCRETEKEARDYAEAIIEHKDAVASHNFEMTFITGDQASWKNKPVDRNSVLGGNVHVIGSPEQVVDQIMMLHKAGCDGIQVNFYDYVKDLEFFGERVLPLLKQAGLRR